jgi:hypothetical protein
LINGCDLTVVEMTDDSMTFNCIPERTGTPASD